MFSETYRIWIWMEDEDSSSLWRFHPGNFLKQKNTGGCMVGTGGTTEHPAESFGMKRWGPSMLLDSVDGQNPANQLIRQIIPNSIYQCIYTYQLQCNWSGILSIKPMWKTEELVASFWKYSPIPNREWHVSTWTKKHPKIQKLSKKEAAPNCAKSQIDELWICPTIFWDSFNMI